jgi:hypothetical protein
VIHYFARCGPAIELVEFLEDFLQFGCNRISDFHRTRFTTNILCSDSILNGSSYSLFDSFRFGREAKRIFQHHSNRKDSSDRVDDSFARDVRRRT